jgi:hypothetical protein
MGGKRLKGVYKWLTAFFPKLSSKVTSKKLKAEDKKITDTSLLTKKGKQMKGSFWMGRQRGSVVGKQLTLLANGGSVKDLHPYTAAVLDAFKKKNWTLVHGEFAVGSLAHGLGTGVDLIVKDAVSSLHHAIELKCGMHGYFTATEGRMLHSLQHVPNSRYAQACVQLAVTHHLLGRTSPHYASGKPHVVHVCDGGVNIYGSPDWARTAALTILYKRAKR